MTGRIESNEEQLRHDGEDHKGEKLMSECEWYPEEMRLSRSDDKPHGEAAYIVGVGKCNYHLCESCAKLKTFSRYKKKPLAVSSRSSEDTSSSDGAVGENIK